MTVDQLHDLGRNGFLLGLSLQLEIALAVAFGLLDPGTLRRKLDLIDGLGALAPLFRLFALVALVFFEFFFIDQPTFQQLVLQRFGHRISRSVRDFPDSI
jgi:hypothetical protein